MTRLLLLALASLALACGGDATSDTTTPTDETYTTSGGDDADYGDQPAPDYGDPDMDDGY